MPDPRTYFAIIIRSSAASFSGRITASILSDLTIGHARSVSASDNAATCILDKKPDDELLQEIKERFREKVLVGELIEL